MSAAKSSKNKARRDGKALKSKRVEARAELPTALAALQAQATLLSMSGEQSALVSSLLSTIHDLTNERAALAAELARSELRVKKLTFLAYGKKTERLSREELIQLALSFGGSEQRSHAAEPEVPHAPTPDEAIEDTSAERDESAGAAEPKRKRPNHPGRTKLSPALERVIEPIAEPAELRLCACCQHEMQVIDHVDHERIEYVPAKIVVHVERREKLACRRSECRGDITTAPRTGESGGRRRAGISLLAQLVEAKCDDGLPVERQREQLGRLGLDVPANTLYTYWTHATSLLLPVAKIALAHVLAEPIVCVDDTSLSVLDKDRKSGIYKGRLWCFTGTRRLAAYTFTETWSAEEIAPSGRDRRLRSVRRLQRIQQPGHAPRWHQASTCRPDSTTRMRDARPSPLSRSAQAR